MTYMTHDFYSPILSTFLLCILRYEHFFINSPFFPCPFPTFFCERSLWQVEHKKDLRFSLLLYFVIPQNCIIINNQFSKKYKSLEPIYLDYNDMIWLTVHKFIFHSNSTISFMQKIIICSFISICICIYVLVNFCPLQFSPSSYVFFY